LLHGVFVIIHVLSLSINSGLERSQALETVVIGGGRELDSELSGDVKLVFGISGLESSPAEGVDELVEPPQFVVALLGDGGLLSDVVPLADLVGVCLRDKADNGQCGS
jgi:hypothetical protein